jgi:hypothetical protein
MLTAPESSILVSTKTLRKNQCFFTRKSDLFLVGILYQPIGEACTCEINNNKFLWVRNWSESERLINGRFRVGAWLRKGIVLVGVKLVGSWTVVEGFLSLLRV